MNIALEKFSKTFLEIISTHAPMRKKRVRSQVPLWFNNEIAAAMKHRNAALKKATTSKDPDDQSYYRRMRNKTVGLIRYFKANFYNNIIQSSLSSNPRKAWQNIRALLNLNARHFIRELKIDGNSETDVSLISNHLNNYFVSLSTPSNKAIDVETTSTIDGNNHFKIPAMSQKFVLDQISSMSVHKAIGTDNIGAKVIKLASPHIIPPLTHIFNLSISTNTFPDQWKMAKVFPLFKGGLPTDPGNYRPISVLPIFSKILERHVANFLKAFLEKHTLLHTYQSGFRSKHSCMTALTMLFHKWFKILDNNESIGVFFVDYSKAFDKVNHNLLLNRLKLYGFSPNALDWFDSYFFNRLQSVHIRGHSSEPKKILGGVPQGSVLGPLCFVLYINELPKILPDGSNCHMYADDVTVFSKDKSIEGLTFNLNRSLNNLSMWSKNNGLSINNNKSAAMLLKTRPPTDNFIVGEFTNVKCTKLLGLQIDNDLKFDAQANHLVKSLGLSLMLLSKASKFVNSHVLTRMYFAFCHPHLIYCLPVYGPHLSKSDKSRIESLRYKMAKLICYPLSFSERKSYFDYLGWLTIDSLIQYEVSLFVYKCLNNLLPASFADFYVFHAGRTRANTFKILKLPFIPKHNFALNELSYYGTKVWNNLPLEIRVFSEVKSFKTSCHRYFYNKQ